ncbi:hypothetical protein PGT21_009996 [Puccinia graminis f. sp. tritici]|uniref:Uncharacterized protein n=1 Tax=Puccinia graminis f. sp. tritici TaxID=56615 RepID=A0A5B0S6V7_PUCGR|nr:hypothetical protein PGT21_009996 [Puccinia graminis f. sp. tritici]KAA1132354.1 hypothetical protein PGTUg99_008357 [Puccinia graminis f. sp. tritici]
MIFLWLLFLLVSQYFAMEGPHPRPSSIGSPVPSNRAGIRETNPYISFPAAHTIDIRSDEGCSSITMQEPREKEIELHERTAQQQNHYGNTSGTKDLAVTINQEQRYAEGIPMAVTSKTDVQVREQTDLSGNSCDGLCNRVIGLSILLTAVLIALAIIGKSTGNGVLFSSYLRRHF